MSVETENILPNSSSYEFPLKGKTIDTTNYGEFFNSVHNLNTDEILLLKKFYLKCKKNCFELFDKVNFYPYDTTQNSMFGVNPSRTNTEDPIDYSNRYDFKNEQDDKSFTQVRKDINRSFPGKLSESQKKILGDILYTVQYIFKISKERFSEIDLEYVQGMNFLAANIYVCCNFNEIETGILLLKLFYEFEYYWVFPGVVKNIYKKKIKSIGFPLFQTLLENTEMLDGWINVSAENGEIYQFHKWKEFDEEGKKTVDFFIEKINFFFNDCILISLMKGFNSIINDDVHYMQKIWKTFFKYGNKGEVDIGFMIMLYSTLDKSFSKSFFDHADTNIFLFDNKDGWKNGFLTNYTTTDKQLKKIETLFNKENLKRIQKIYHENYLQEHDYAMFKFKKRKGNIFSKFKGGRKKRRYTQKAWIKIKKNKTFKKH